MLILRKPLMILWLLLFLICGQPATAKSAGQNKLEGLVLSKNNQPLAGVHVRLYRGSEPLPKSVYTGADGSYSVSFDAGNPISLVRYDLTNWFPSIVENISGARDHRINKVIFQLGETLSVQELKGIGATMIILGSLDTKSGTSPDEFSKTYGPVMSDLRKHMEFPDWVLKVPDQSPRAQSDAVPKEERASLLTVENALAVRESYSAIRVEIEGATPSSGWSIRVAPNQLGDTLRLEVLGKPPSQSFSSREKGRFVISEVFDVLQDVKQVIVIGEKGEINVDISRRH